MNLTSNFCFVTTSGTLYYVGEGTITRMAAQDDKSNIPVDIIGEAFEWNVEPVVGKRADYRLSDLSRPGRWLYVTTSEVSHIWPATQDWASSIPAPEPVVEVLSGALLASDLVEMFATTPA